MKVLAVILNLLLPGLGSLLVGRVGAGIVQLMLLFVAVVLNFTVIGAVVGIPLAVVNWIWALVTAVNGRPQPVVVDVRVVNETAPAATAPVSPAAQSTVARKVPLAEALPAVPAAPIEPVRTAAMAAQPGFASPAAAMPAAAAAPGGSIPSRLLLTLGIAVGAALAAIGGVTVWQRWQQSQPGDAGRAPTAAVPSPSAGSFPAQAPQPDIRVGNRYRYLTTALAGDKPASLIDREVTSMDADKVTVGIYNVGASAPSRLTFYDRQWNYLGSEGANLSAQFVPALKYFDFPLYPGKRWTLTSVETQSPSGRQKTHAVDGTVGNWQMLSVAGGTYRALPVTVRMRTTDGAATLDTTDESWYAPEVARTVKSTIHTCDGNGKTDSRIIELQQFVQGQGR